MITPSQGPSFSSDSPLRAFLLFLVEDTKVGEPTARQYAGHLRRLVRWLEQRYQAALLQATTDDLNHYKTELVERQKPASVNGALVAMRRFCRFYGWAADTGRIARNPARHVTDVARPVATLGSDRASLFWDEHATSIIKLAADGASKRDIVTRFGLLYPAIPEETVRYALDNSGLSLSQSSEPQHFADSVLESGVWYVVGLNLGLEPNPGIALTAMDIREANELRQALRERGVDDATIANAIATVTEAKERALSSPLSLSNRRYDELRAPMGDSQNQHGTVHPWPADSQTVIKRLGNGYWSDAMATLGLVPSKKGRSRGLLSFGEDSYKQALQNYVGDRKASGSRTSFSDYDEWRQRESRAGRTWPAAVSIRNRYGSWTSAMRVSSSLPPTLNERLEGRWATNLSAQLLHVTRRDMNEKLEQISGCSTADERDPLVRMFLKDYAGTFETDRRKWLRAMIQADPSSVTRRLDPAGPKLEKKQRDALTSTPPDLDSALSDIYLDRTLSKPSGAFRSSGGVAWSA